MWNMDDERPDSIDPADDDRSTRPMISQVLDELRSMREGFSQLATRDALAKLDGRITVLQGEFTTFRQDLTTVREDVATISIKVDRLGSELRDIKHEHRRELAETRAEMHATFANDLKANAARFADIERRLTALEDANRPQ
jgi:chromosome segregation ATPase